MLAQPHLIATLLVVISFVKLFTHKAKANVTLASGTHGAVASEEARCSDIGVQVLRDNGTAVDAAIASGLCIGAINAFSSGVGGGGFMLVRLPNSTANFIDFREKAPAAATADMFAGNANASQSGGLAVAIPGELRGYETAHRLYGRLPWARLFQPTIDLCENGFTMAVELNYRLNLFESFILTTPAFREIYTVYDPATNTTKIAPVGTRIYRKNLAKTLRAVAEHGAVVFYEGPIARAIARTVRQNNGILTASDLKNYQPTIRDPVVGTYRNRTIYTSPAPASGPVLVQILNVLDQYEFGQNITLDTIRAVEALKWGFASRTELGDTSFTNITDRISQIISKEEAHWIKDQIEDDRTFDVPHYQPKYSSMETPGTTQVSVVDEDDMSVAMTVTVNLIFGSKLMVQEYGIILNNEMDDFSTPGIINFFGLPPSRNNFIVPGKEPLSSISATIVEYNGKFEAALGASGGSWIISATLQSLINYVDYGMNAYDSIASPRYHHQLVPNQVNVDDWYAPSIINALQVVGHNLTLITPGTRTSAAQLVSRLPDGTVNAGSDPRKNGQASAY